MPKTISIASACAALVQLALVFQFWSEFIVMLRKGGSSIGPVGTVNVFVFFVLSSAVIAAALWCTSSAHLPRSFKVLAFVSAVGLVAGGLISLACLVRGH
jgi:hypothetical protein